jgi:transaldolase
MQFFLDTGDINEIKKAIPWGIVDGVTTNPSLIAKTGRKREEVIKEICHLVDGPISAEVISLDTEGMLKEASALSKIHANVVIKLPLIPAGIAACKRLTADGVRTNVTLCFSVNQALLAAKVGATYISPFVGRLDDQGQAGMELISEIKAVYDNYGYKTQILAASIRHQAHVREASLFGAHVSTMPLKVMEGLFNHPLTDIGLKQFLEDYKKSGI